MRRTTLICIMWLFTMVIYGQGETSNWYFGTRAGIEFNSDGSVTALEDGRISTFEGCATISDELGDLLFYTDGITVYDRTHSIMQNGQALYGDISSTQSAIIVPDPGNPQRFYIFTVDTRIFEDDPDFGLNYSVVDMSLNNNLGAVTNKNINLLADCSEKITAVIKDCEEQSFWVLTLATADGSPGLLDTYHAFEVNSSGVVATSVKSNFGDLNLEDPRGYLKLSPDGTKVASANASSGLYLYDFDANTGLLSNELPIAIEGANSVAYGVEFSPSGGLLYVHASNDQQGQSGHTSSLYQYDLSAADIESSVTTLASGNEFRAALQLGANGKIYRTIASSYTVGTSYLGVIHSPDEAGMAANYEHQAVNLGSGRGNGGLPPFVQSFFNKTAIIRNADGTTSTSLELCEGENFSLQTDDIPGASYIWEKDDVVLAIAGPVFLSSNSMIDDSGRYVVTITTPDPKECPIVGEAFIKVNPLPVATDLFLVQCDVDPGASEDGLSIFNLEAGIADQTLEYEFYESITDRDNEIAINQPEAYSNITPFNQTLYYRVRNEFDCYNYGQMELEVLSNPFAAQSDFTLYSCDKDASDDQLVAVFDLGTYALEEYPDLEVSFHNNPTDVALKNSPLPGQFETVTTTVYARLELDNECLGVEKIDLQVLQSPDFNLKKELLLCTDNPELVINGPEGMDFYRWELLNGGNTTVLSEVRTLTVRQLGQYRLTAGFNYDFSGISIECEKTESFQVLPSNKANFEEILIDDFREENSIQIQVSGDGDYEYSLDGESYQSDESFVNVAPGFYTVHVRDRNGCGINTREISVLGYPKFFTPNGDGINDIWRITGADEQFQSDALITIFDRFGKLLAQISPLDEGWNGHYNASPLPASDYWFRVQLSDGRELTGHFALKR
ncbi:MAG: T9SS type B sorting domain-containing protein [Flavobacteriaceae bacterium]